MQSTLTAPAPFNNVRISLYVKDSTRALATVRVADLLVVNGLRVIEGKNGLFVSMPSKKEVGGEYKDICFATSRMIRDQLQALVLAAYKAELEKAGAPA